MPSTDLDDFVAMSAALTGFTADFLRPALDPLNLSQAYFDQATARTAGQPATLQTLLTAYRAVQGQAPQAIADALLETASASPSSNAMLAQSIVLLWYFGAWYAPLVPGAPQPTTAPGAVQVVSSNAYTHGLVWNVMQAHPMGFSELTFGYWSTPPGPMSQFGVNEPTGGDR
ncbi:MAG TPA: hypothetical protein VFP84_17990 [Kofleriaceae bacterium]|nr:hypothetical protein [Kofleriaceae bacterium]